MIAAVTTPDVLGNKFFAVAAPREAPAPEPVPGPERVPGSGPERPKLPNWAIGALVAVGVGAGLWIYTSGQQSPSASGGTPVAGIPTVTVETTRFENVLRIGGTVGAMDYAVIRAPRMEGGRDRGRGSSMTIQTMAEGGTIVEPGTVVAEFESRATQDSLDTYASTLAQTKATVAARKAEMQIATETLRQDFRTTKAEADKAALDLQTAEVRSLIQAEIFRLLAEEGEASSIQLEREVELQEDADAAESRSLDITVEQDVKRMARTESDLEKMKVRTPVGGLVVVDTMFTRGTFQQASPGDQVYAGALFMRVVDLSSMAVFAQLNQADTQLVELGTPVSVRLDAYPDVVFEGRIRSIGAMATSSGSGGGRRGPPGSSGSRGEWIKKVPVEVEILTEDERIKPDLSASADVLIESRPDALVVPRAAVAQIGERPVVWVQGDAGFEAREVRLGSIGNTKVVVESGLETGEVIAAQALAEEDTQLARL
ncbi:MAG: efflux RND transporter periplasmic adaptor subunit [Bryobacterales bacterium]|nr:efflux RND transporter periplasmic adaptor subunit [Bryobacterales bacterium]